MDRKRGRGLAAPLGMTFFVPGIPVTEGSTKAFVSGGRAVVTHDRGPELLAWRKAVRLASLEAADRVGWGLRYDGPVSVRVLFALPAPKRPKDPFWACTKPDLDKLQRAIGDSIAPYRQSGILTDDSRIVKWVAEKTYTPIGGSNGATITVAAL